MKHAAPDASIATGNGPLLAAPVHTP
jgi:hypothetical protein